MARIVASGATTVVPSAAGMLAQLVGSLALLVIMAPQIAWMLIPAGIVFAGFTLGFRRVPKRLHKRIRETDGCARSHLIECLNSLLVVKSFQREDFAERGAAALLEDHRAACMRRNRFSNLCNVGFGLAMRAAYLVAAAYCAYGILEGSVSYESTLPLGLLWRRRELPLGDYSPIRKDAYSISPKADLDKELRKQERMLVVFIDDLDRLSSEEIRLVFRIVTLLLIFLRLFMCSRLIVVWYQER